MVVAGQNDHLVAMHSDVADGHVIIRILWDITCGLDCGEDLQVGVKEDQRLVFSCGMYADKYPPRGRARGILRGVLPKRARKQLQVSFR